jgi:hypothetical protein
MPSSDERLTAQLRQRLRRMAALSLTLHLAVLLLFLIILPDTLPETQPPDSPQGEGSPPSLAMVMDVGTAEGVKQPAPSFAPAKVAPGEMPSMAPPPPMPQPASAQANTAKTALIVPPSAPAPQAEAPLLPAVPPPIPTPRSHATARLAPRPTPQVATKNTLPVPLSHTMRQPNRTTNNNQGANEDSPGPKAANSLGAPAHSTNGPDSTTSTGGEAGEDGQPPLLRWVAHHIALDATCTGSLDLGPTTQHWGPHLDQFPEWRDAGVKAPIRAHFYHTDDGTAWVQWSMFARAPVDRLVTVAGSSLSWIGQYGAFFSVRVTGGNHFTGLATGIFGQPGQVVVELTCTGSDAHPF